MFEFSSGSLPALLLLLRLLLVVRVAECFLLLLLPRWLDISGSGGAWLLRWLVVVVVAMFHLNHNNNVTVRPMRSHSR